NESLRVSKALTIAVWVRVNRLRGNQYVVSKRGWNIYIGADGLARFETRDATNSRWDTLPAKHRIRAGEWVFITAVHNPKVKRLEIYVNGILSNTKPRADGRIGGVWRSKLLLGMYASRTQFLDGLIAELRIYKRALTEQEIATLHRQGLKRVTDALRSPTYRISVHPRFYFTKGNLSADVFIRALKPLPKNAYITAELIHGAKVLQRRKLNLLSCGRSMELKFDLRRLVTGSYKIRVIAFNNDGSEICRSVVPITIPKSPWWLHTMEGFVRDVLPPWKPIQVSRYDAQKRSIAISVWGRIYEFGAVPFPKRIVSNGRELLSAPIRIIAQCNGRMQSWRGEALDLLSRAPYAVHIRQRAQSDALALNASSRIEYDGMVQVHWRIIPKQRIQLDRLVLEIPMRSSIARYVYYYPERYEPWTAHRPRAFTNAMRMAFNPVIWLGDERCGVEWFCESDRNWFNADAKRAIEIVREDDTVVLRLHIVDEPLRLDGELDYTFGLQATPVKPIETDAWDYKTACVYTPVYGLEESRHGGASALDALAKLGVRTLALMDWTDILCYNMPTHPEKLHRFVRECHKRGIKVIVYFGYQISDVAPEFTYFVDECAMWTKPQPHSWAENPDNYPPKPTQQVVRVCYRSIWRNFVVAGVARLMDEFDIDGVYLDGTAIPVAPCYNIHHGCGYRKPDGSAGGTYSIFAGRELMRRIYTVVKMRKRDGQVNLHQSGYMLAPVMAWVTSYWDGEQLGGWKRGAFALDRLPLDYFRTEFMGHQWGIPAEFLHYCTPMNFKQAWAIALLHDVPVRPFVGNWNDVELAARVWRVMDEFERKGASWIPYWRNAKFVSASPDGIYVSLYRHRTSGLLLVVS
ncbi:MAG TPA: hypothetical protein EYP10_10995, partial [Armatimonadetes bacterium]|nr:hypothetical protein [Armatimonadota bacterium]